MNEWMNEWKACSMKWVWLSILSLSSLIRLFLLCLLTFSVIATKYSLKDSAIVCWSVIFLPSTSRACISLLFLILPDSLFIIPHYFVPPRSKYSPQHPILKHPQPTILCQCELPNFIPIQNNWQNYGSVYVNLFYFWIAKKKTKDSAPITTSIPQLPFDLNFFLNGILIH